MKRTPSTDDSPVFESDTVPLDGTRLHYRVAGDGPPLVFCHAGIADQRMWDGLVERFVDRFRVLTYDFRGFGRSEHAPGTFSHTFDLETLLGALDIESVHLVGASMGGAVAVDFALAHPERVNSVSLLAPALSGFTFTDRATLTGWRDADDAFEVGEYDEAARIELSMWLAGPNRTLDEVNPGVRERVREMSLRSYELVSPEAEELDPDEPAVDRLDALAAPTLVVLGDDDVSDMHRIARLIEREVPDVQLVTVPDTAHLPSMERPETISRYLSSFLDEVGGRI